MNIGINEYNSSIQLNTEKLSFNNAAEKNKRENAAERADKVTISAEGRKFIEKNNSEDKIKKINDFRIKHDELYSEQTASAMEHVTDAMETAMEIYRRIAGGAKVSPDDEQFLMLYSRPMVYGGKERAGNERKE